MEHDLPTKPLSEVCEIIMGQSPPGSTYNESGNGLPFFQGVADFGPRYPTRRVWCSAPSRIAQRGDVLLSIRAPIGNVNLASETCAVGRGLAIVRAKTQEDQTFVEFALRSADTDWEAMEGSGTVFANATRSQLETLEIPWPNRGSRSAIARVLGSLDDKIELNRRMNQTLEEICRALFKFWFVDFGPVRAKAEGRWKKGESLPGMPADMWDLWPSEFEESEIGEIPKGWGVSRVGEVVGVSGGSTPSTSNGSFWDGGSHAWATPKDLAALRTPVLLQTERSVTDAGLATISSGLLPKGTVLLSSRAPIGYLAFAEIPVAVNQGFIAIQCKGAIPNQYVLRWAEANIEEIKAVANGTTFLEVNKQNFRLLPMLVPHGAVLDRWNQLASGFYRMEVVHEKEISTLSSARDALLPKLLSGEIRLKVDA